MVRGWVPAQSWKVEARANQLRSPHRTNPALRADSHTQGRTGPPRRRVARAGEIRVGADEQLLLSLGARIVDERGLLLFGEVRGGVPVLAGRPALPLLPQAMDGGNVVLAQQRDVEDFGQEEEFDVRGGIRFELGDRVHRGGGLARRQAFEFGHSLRE